MKRIFTKSVLAPIIPFLILSGTLFAEKDLPQIHVLLKNGDKISGILNKIGPKKITIRTDYAGYINIPIPKIKLLPIERKIEMILKNSRKVTLYLCEIYSGKFRVKTKHGSYVLDPATVTQLKNANNRVSISSKIDNHYNGVSKWRAHHWQGNIDFGYNIDRGTTSSDNMFLRAKGYHNSGRSKFTLRGHIFYGLKDGEISKKEIIGTTRYDYKLRDKFFAFAQFSAEYDAIEKINLRHSYNTGMGYTFVNTPELNLDMDTGLGWQQELYMYDGHKDNGSVLLEQHIFWKMNSRLFVDQKFSLIPYITGHSRFRFVMDMNVKSPVAKHLLLTFGVVNRYDSRPQEGVEKNDFMALTGFGYVF